MIRGFAEQTSLARRIIATSISIFFALDGIYLLLTRPLSLLHLEPSTTFTQICYGPLSIFTAAFLMTDITAIYLRTPLFQLVWIVKFMFALFFASICLSILIYERHHDIHLFWFIARCVAACLWIWKGLEELLWWNPQAVKSLELPGIRIRSSSSVGSDISSDGSDIQYEEL